jgi:natural product biosynthesis luciferase-like monooxygenase protein
MDEERAGIGFGTFFFAAVGDDAGQTYRLMLDCARLTDELGLDFVSTPERHFHPFGGAFPDPAVSSAAIAAVTERVQIRAGSVVTPLHHPARIVEDFAMVDCLSGGRVAISVGSGWNVNDFVLAPQEYDNRRERMIADLDAIRAAWRDGTWTAQNPRGIEVSLNLYPRPRQPELPVWITASRSEETFRQAGKLGVNVLTHLENQSISALSEKIALYRANFTPTGQAAGKVTVMMHTYVGATGMQARSVAAPWLRRYLATAIDLESLAVQSGGSMSGRRAGRPFLAEENARRKLAEVGLNRYLDGNSLIGSVEECAEIAGAVSAAGADEIACLVDFIPDPEHVLAGVHRLAQVAGRCATAAGRSPALR